jgi:polyisoprenoid-binding protein YceI
MRTALVSLLAVSSLGCAPDLTQGRAVAVIIPDAQAAEPAPGVALQLDASQSRVHALGAKITGTHDVWFPSFTGELKLDGGKPSALGVTVNMGAMKSDNERLTGHLMSPDFFDTTSFPTASFASTSIAAGGEGAATHTVTGDLTIRGVTKRVAFPATIEVKEGDMKAKTEFVIDRQDFGVSFPGMPDDLIKDEVALTIELAS